MHVLVHLDWKKNTKSIMECNIVFIAYCVLSRHLGGDLLHL